MRPIIVRLAPKARAFSIVLVCVLACIGLSARAASSVAEASISTTAIADRAREIHSSHPARNADGAEPRARFLDVADASTLTLASGAGARVLAPSGADARANGPRFTLLHGAGGSETDTCDRMKSLVEDGSWLFCPRGNYSYGGDSNDWVGEPEERASFVDGVEKETAKELGLVDRGAKGRVLMGFSRGGFVVRDFAQSSLGGRYSGLVIIGAATIPDADLLKKNGVERVVLAAGDYDGARPMMSQALVKLCSQKIPVEFVSLGKVWHALPSDSVRRMGTTLRWVAGEGEAHRATTCIAPMPVHVPGT